MIDNIYKFRHTGGKITYKWIEQIRGRNKSFVSKDETWMKRFRNILGG